MSSVNETLQELVERRLREMGQRRGRGESISLREAWLRLPERENGSRAVSYETVRRIREYGHTKIGDQIADALATMFDVDVDEVLRAAGQRPRVGPWELPVRAQRLTPAERLVVEGVIDAILDAADVVRGQAPDDKPAGRPNAERLRAVAAEGDPDDASIVDELARRARAKDQDRGSGE